MCIRDSDGTVGMATWRHEDAQRVGTLRDARQNGMALVEPGADGTPVAGRTVEPVSYTHLDVYKRQQAVYSWASPGA